MADAQFMTGLMYHRGIGTVPDDTKAVEWLSKGAANGDWDSEALLGRLYEFGLGTTKDLSKACQLYLSAATKGTRRAAGGLGRCYFSGAGGFDTNPVEALKWFKVGATAGDPSSQYGLAYMHAVGARTAPTSLEAGHWAMQAAAQGHTAAQEMLASAHKECAAAEPREPYRSYAIFHQCLLDAQSGDPQAQYVVGSGFYGGRPVGSVLKDRTQAAAWFRKAAEQGHQSAQRRLGLQHLEGDGVTLDLFEAYAWTSCALHGLAADDPQTTALNERLSRIDTALETADAKRVAAARAEQYIRQYTAAPSNPQPVIAPRPAP